MAKKTKVKAKKSVETITHDTDKRKNIPTAEHQAVVTKEQQKPLPVRYPRNVDLDPQLVWRGKDELDWSDLVVHAPPIYIQEKVHPKALVDDLLRRSAESKHATERSSDKGQQLDLFADFNGIPEGADKTDFYQHDANWSNRMILGDSLQVMASLAEREGLRGRVQCIYIDPPYGIKFNSNFQWSTTSRDVKDGKADHITREPEQVKAFRDTWRDGIHSYLTYLRDRLTVARDLLTDSGSIFVQIGDENVHRVRVVMDEVFGEDNCVSQITFVKTGGLVQDFVNNKSDFILWFVKDRTAAKARHLYTEKSPGAEGGTKYNGVELPNGARITLKQAGEIYGDALPDDSRTFRLDKTTSEANPVVLAKLRTGEYRGSWKTTPKGMGVLEAANRISPSKTILNYVRYIEDFPVHTLSNVWDDIGGIQSRADPKIYVVQTATEAVKRCILMATDPGDLVLDPTCGSGTTAMVAEQWGRRWITIDTSRVALALARARIMGARYPFYLLADSRDGQLKEADVTLAAPSSQPVHGNIRHGFVYERVPHITLSSIANNAEIDVIWDQWQARLEPLREKLNKELGRKSPSPQPSSRKRGEGAGTEWEEWEIPRDTDEGWSAEARKIHKEWWEARIARQNEIDKSIAAKAEFEYLYDKPYEDKKIVRVAGPFTVESLSPHRMLDFDENDELIDRLKVAEAMGAYSANQTFDQMIVENLKTAGVQQAHKEDKITFTSLAPWPGKYVCAEGKYNEGDVEKRAGVFIGPEFGTVQRTDLVEAARECGDAQFDVLVACAFNYEAHANEFSKLGRIPVLKARMNADLHMAADLKATGKGNLFVVFGEPDIELFEGGSDSLRNELDRCKKRIKKLEEERERRKDASAGDGPRVLTEAEKEELERCQSFIDHAADVPNGQWVVSLRGVDVFDPTTGEVRSDSADGIACWFVDTDYNGESFFVRHAYFLGQNDPYSALKTTLKAEINADAWESLHSDLSRPFARPTSGRIAVKVINHLGDEVMKVFKVSRHD